MSQPYDPNQGMGWDPGGPGYTGPPASAYPLGQPVHPDPGPYGNPGYANPGYANPGYANPGYAAQGYAGPGYPGAGHPGYGPPSYSIYPDPARRFGRPGQVIGTAVLSYVQAGLLTLAGVILLSGSWAASDFSNGDGSQSDWGAQFALAGFGDLAAAGLLIAGGVLFAGGRRLGRTLVTIALGLCLVEAVFWLAKLGDGDGVIVPWVIFFIVLPIIGSSLSFAAPVRDWLDRTSPRSPSNSNVT